MKLQKRNIIDYGVVTGHRSPLSVQILYPCHQHAFDSNEPKHR
jgi:hypothetical protein